MLSMSKYLIWVVLTSCLLACGCNTAKDVGKTLGDLTRVRDELIKKFGEQDVNLHVNSFQNRTNISVTYVNSPLNQQTTEDRGKRAQETAEIVRKYYPSIKSVGEIWVGFMRVTTRMVVFHRTEMIDAHVFDNEARVLRDPGSAPEEPGGVAVRYLESQNKTEFSSNILLEGTAEKGVTLLPHFSVAGDANKIRPKPPGDVSLDFAVFSEKPKFPNITKIVFLSDNKVAYQTEDQFSTSKIDGGMYSQFLYLKVPTAAFLKIASGSTIKIRLDEYEYTLTEIQIVKFQRMSEYIRKSQNTRS